MGVKIEKAKEVGKKYGWLTGLSAIVIAIIPYMKSISDNHHAEEMARINANTANIKKDSANASEYQIFNNNKIDERECDDKVRDSLLNRKKKHKHHCN